MKNTILDLVKFWAKVTPNKEAYVFLKNSKEDEHITFKQVYDGADKYAGYLKAKGVVKGDRIIILAEQDRETIYAIYGTLMAGAIFVLIPTPKDRGKRQRLMYTLKSSNPKFIICNESGEKYLDDNGEVPIIKTSDVKFVGEYVKENLRGEDIACLQYTSGSINEPKGIVWTHENIIESMYTLSRYIFPDETYVTWLPFFHSMGLCTSILLNMYNNNRNIIMNTQSFVNDPIEWLKKVSEYKSTMVWAPNSAYLTCVNLLKNNNDLSLDLSSIKYMINCSESIQPSDWEKIAKGFVKYGLRENALIGLYGLSEATGEVSGGIVHNLYVDESKLENNLVIPAKYNKSGKLLSGVGSIVDTLDVCIVNPDTLTECKANEVGEIWVQGDKNAYGYWNNLEATEESFKAKLPGHKGTFLRTGDLGSIVDNQLYIIGRMKEMIIVNGHNIFPRDIELDIKKEVEELRDNVVYAFSITIGNRENIIIAIEGKIEKDKYDSIAKEVKKAVYKYFDIEPYDIIMMDNNELIRTDNGKIALNKNKQAYISNSLNILYRTNDISKKNISITFTEKGLKIKKIFEDVLETECTSMKDDFFQLGGSSLKTVVLVKQISESFNIKFTSEDLLNYSSVEDIEKFIDIKNGTIKDDESKAVSTKEIEDNESKEEKEKRMHLVESEINSNIEIKNIEIYHPKNKKNVNEIIEEFKNKGEDIESLVKEQLGKEILYLTDNENENSLTMALEVTNRILKSSGLEGKDFDMIVSSSTVPEYTVPPMSLILQQDIKGKEDAVCYDINANCAGMTFAMSEILRRMESDKRINRVLLVGTEFTSMHMREEDYQMKANMSDAACAVIFERTNRKCGLIDFKSYINIENVHDYAFPGCGFSKIYKSEKIDMYTNRGKLIWNADVVAEKITDFLKENNLKVSDIGMFCSSQLVSFYLKLLRKKLKVSEDKLLYIGNKYGYTGTCSPFTALYEGILQEKVKRGDYLLFWTIASGGYYVFTLIKY